MPDVLLIDGGPGQLDAGAARARGAGDRGSARGRRREGARSQAGPGAPVSARARGAAASCRPDSPALHLIQQLRDEAHRFAITGHRARRQKARTRSPLEEIRGLGPKKRRELLRQFGGLQALTRAGVDDLDAGEGHLAAARASRSTNVSTPIETGLKRRMHFNLPNALTWFRIVAIPLVVIVFYLPVTVGATRRGAVVRARRHHRLARRLSRAPPRPDLELRRVPRSGRRQADRRDRAGAARAGACGRRRGLRALRLGARTRPDGRCSRSSRP